MNNLKQDKKYYIKKVVSQTKFDKKAIEKIINFEEDEPMEILGRHYIKTEDCTVINAYLPRAEEAWVQFTNKKNIEKFLMTNLNSGFYQLVLNEEEKNEKYKICFKDQSGYIEERVDPYSFSTEITDYDIYLLGEGNYFRAYEKFGAKIKVKDGIKGVQFTVWAPHARTVSVIGNFNHWRPGSHPMNRVKLTGIWDLFIPGLNEDELYKFAIKTPEGHILSKSDPYAFKAEIRPNTASVISSLEKYKWSDEKWISEREKDDHFSKPISIYEVHLGSWKRDGKKNWDFLSYKDFAHDLINYVKEMGYTHIELMPIMEHPLDASWGYQTISYYAPTSRFGNPEEFMYFIDLCHQNNIGVILDWVPSHFPKDMHGLNTFDGRQIYAYEDWKRGEHKEWGTLVFDFFRPEVKSFLISNALFWIDKYHIDGLRVDAVASMLYLDYSRKDSDWSPNMFGGREHLEAIDFIKKLNEVIHSEYKGVLTIAEESTSWGGVSRPTYLGGLGFSMKWNMGWMHDTLEYFCKDPIYRKYHQDMLTFSMIYAFTENFVLPISHDEVVYGKRSLLEKMPGDDWQKFANLRLFLGYMYSHPGKKLLFMGADIAQRDEWNFNSSLDWHLLNYEPHKKIKKYMQDLNKLYKENKALYEVDFDWTGFEWVDFSDATQSIVLFIRWSKNKEEMILVCCNMTPTPRYDYRIGIPKFGFYREIFNSDSEVYGGANIGNMGGVKSDDISWHSKPYSINVNLPPLGITLLKYEAQKIKSRK